MNWRKNEMEGVRNGERMKERKMNKRKKKKKGR